MNAFYYQIAPKLCKNINEKNDKLFDESHKLSQNSFGFFVLSLHIVLNMIISFSFKYFRPESWILPQSSRVEWPFPLIQLITCECYERFSCNMDELPWLIWMAWLRRDFSCNLRIPIRHYTDGSEAIWLVCGVYRRNWSLLLVKPNFAEDKEHHPKHDNLTRCNWYVKI